MEFTEARIADFDATQAVGLLISNTNFDRIGMDELEHVRDNHVTMRRHFDFLGIHDVIEV